MSDANCSGVFWIKRLRYGLHAEGSAYAVIVLAPRDELTARSFALRGMTGNPLLNTVALDTWSRWSRRPSP